jgi:tellurite resistance protein TehA-like permease
MKNIYLVGCRISSSIGIAQQHREIGFIVWAFGEVSAFIVSMFLQDRFFSSGICRLKLRPNEFKEI